MRKFKKNLKIDSLDDYVKNKSDATEDLKLFLISLEGSPSKTIHSHISALKSFLTDHDIPFSENGWKKLRRRGFMPKRIKAETRDKKLQKNQLKRLLNYLDLRGKAQVLFLLSSGARVGESVQLKLNDLDLESDPPRAYIRAEYTKGGVGARTIFMSYEARDAIKDWLAIKDTIKKRNGGNFAKDKLFDWTVGTSTYLWNRAIKKAGLDEKDDKTNRRIYHLHGLRKFFRSQIGLDVDLTHALMGHNGYLDEAYLRLNEKEIAEAYQQAMPNVSVYSIENTELKQETQNLREELNTVKQKEQQKNQKIKELETQLKFFNSKEYTNNLVATVAKSLKGDAFEIVYKSKKTKTISVTIPIENGKELKRLMKEGYNIAGSDDDNFYLEKETDQ
jgi:integrase